MGSVDLTTRLYVILDLISHLLTKEIQFTGYLPVIYPLATGLLARDVAPEIRLGLKMYFERVGLTHGITEAS